MTQSGALSGLRVVDLTRILAGPLCTMWLGDMGADVIKIERPGRGDDTRSWGPPYAGTESAYFLGVNRNKRSVTLDLTADEGQAILARLISRADVVVDNFKISTLDRWGFTDDWYEANAPQAVRCTISGYGSTGPRGGQPGYDFILQGETGLMSITGEVDGQPMKVGVALVDVCTGMFATISILGALEARRRTGKGQRTEASLHDTGIQMLVNVASNHLITGEEAGRFANGHPNIVPYRTFAAADGDLAVSVGNDDQFRRLAEALGHPEWVDDDRFARNQDRVRNRVVMDEAVASCLLLRTRAEWIEILSPLGIPVGPINSVSEALSSEQTVARGMVDQLDHPSAGSIRLVGIPFKMFGTPESIRRAPPTLGQHSGEVLTKDLGLAQHEIDELVAAQITTVETA